MPRYSVWAISLTTSVVGPTAATPPTPSATPLAPASRSRSPLCSGPTPDPGWGSCSKPPCACIPAGQQLDGPLLVKKIPVTTNLYLTSGGAVFTYGPYEISACAQGEISVFIPMADLLPLLLPAVTKPGQLGPPCRT